MHFKEDIATEEITTEQQENSASATDARELNLKGDAWKAKDSETYASTLDMNGVSDLFSEEKTNKYEEKLLDKEKLDQQLLEYAFKMPQTESVDEQLVDVLFGQELRITATKDYKTDNGTGVFLVTAILILVGMIFACFMVKFNIKRKKKREKYATQINMEN